MITPEFWSIPVDAPSESELVRKTATLKQRLLDIDLRLLMFALLQAWPLKTW